MYSRKLRMQKTVGRIQNSEYRKGRFVGREKPAAPRESGNIKPEALAFGLNTAPFCLLNSVFCLRLHSPVTISPSKIFR